MAELTAQLTIVYWQDIPAQVIVAQSIAKKPRWEQVKLPLNTRFEKAIDQAAMQSKASSTDAYLADWRKEKIGECEDNLTKVATEHKERLESAFDSDTLAKFVANGGHKP